MWSEPSGKSVVNGFVRLVEPVVIEPARPDTQVDEHAQVGPELQVAASHLAVTLENLKIVLLGFHAGPEWRLAHVLRLISIETLQVLLVEIHGAVQRAAPTASVVREEHAAKRVAGEKRAELRRRQRLGGRSGGDGRHRVRGCGIAAGTVITLCEDVDHRIT